MDDNDQCFPRRKMKHKIQHDIDSDFVPKKQRLLFSDEKFKDIPCLNVGNITKGMLLLGVITEVKETDLKMALPGCLTGTVDILSISTPYSELLKNYMSNRDCSLSEPIPSLQSLFTVGEIYPCKVVSFEKHLVSLKTSISLSINPTDVNFNLRPSSLFSNMILNAAMRSIEDRGYIMDLGISGLLGFMEFTNFQNSSRLSVGQVTPVSVKSLNTISSKIVSLTSVTKNKSISKICETMSLDSLIPGMTVVAVVNKCCPKGIYLTCLGHEAFVCHDHIPKGISPNKLVATEVTGIILYIHPLSRIIYLTMNLSMHSEKRFKAMHFYDKWDLIERASISAVDQQNVHFDIGHPSYRGQCSKRNMPQQDEGSYSTGTVFRCRVLFIHPLDNIVIVGLKHSHLNLTVIKKDKLVVGAIFNGKVKKFVKHGMLVTLSQNICGFVRDVHMADGVIGIPGKMYQEGSEVKCRILSVDLTSAFSRVMLTCKKSLCDPRLTILSAYEDAQPGLVTKGVIVKIMANYILVLFFNNVQGLVPKSNTDRADLEETYFIGQVVKCRVTFCKPNQRDLHLSLKIHEDENPQKEYNSSFNSKLGQVVDVCITAKKKNGFQVQLCDKSHFAFLPFDHLSDYKQHIRDFCELYSVNDTFKVLVFSTTSKAIVTAKYSFIQAAERKMLVENVADCHVGEVVPCVVKCYEFNKTIFELGNNVIGHALGKVKKRFKTTALNSSTYVTCMAKVLSSDVKANEIKLNTFTSEVYDKNPEYSLDALENYLQDRDKIATLCQSKTGILKKMSHFVVGTIVTVIATKVTEVSVYCTLEEDIAGHAILNDGSNIKEGQCYSAVVLFVDFASKCVEVSFSRHLIKCISKQNGSRSSNVKIHQVIKSRVLFVGIEFILVALEGHAVGSIVYLPSRRFLNDDYSRSPLYSVGEFHHIIIKRECYGYLLGVLKKHNQLYGHSFSKMENRNCASDIQIGKNPMKSKTLNFGEKDIKPSETLEFDYRKPCSSTGNDFEDLPIESQISARITNVKSMQVNLMINDYLKGRVHITNIGCIQEGQFPLKEFQNKDVLDVVIAGYYKKLVHNYLPIAHCKFVTYAECCLERNSHPNSLKKFIPGDTAFGFVKKVCNDSLVLCLSPCQSTELPYLHISENPKELRTIKKHFKLGQCVSGKVLHLLPSLTLTKLEKFELIPEKTIAGYVEAISLDTGLSVKLAHGYTGLIAITDISDDYASTVNIMSKLLKKQYIQCFVLEVNQTSKTCILSTRSSRLYGKRESIVDHEVLYSEINVGQCFRGFVKLITSSVMHVNIGYKLVGTIDLTSTNEDLVKGKYSIGSVIGVKIVSLLHGLTLTFMQKLDDVQVPTVSTSVLQVNEEFDWNIG